MTKFVLAIVPFLCLLQCGAANSAELDCTGVKAVHPRCSSNETPYQRDFFYVGGRYVEAATGRITVDQVYVEKLSPTSGSPKKRHPLVFFHGGGTSAVTWLNTPDNRVGWASYFVSKGYHVYLVDAYSGGRSPANNFKDFNMFTGSGPEAAEIFTGHTDERFQFPGSGRIGDPVFEAFQKTQIPWTNSFVLQEMAMRAGGCELLRLLGTPAFLIAHSLGSFYPVLLSNDCPEFVRGSVNLEPATTPFWRYNIGSLGGVPQSPWGLTFSPLSYEPPVNNASELSVGSVGNDTLTHRNCYQQVEPVRQLPNVSSVPYLGITSEGFTHKTFAHCIKGYLEQVGGNPEWVYLEDVGIRGNSHFMHLELNNLEIAKFVEKWIAKK